MSLSDPGDYTDGRFFVLVNQDHALAIASGYVPNAVKAQVRTMLSWREEDERRAGRPLVPQATTTRRGPTRRPLRGARVSKLHRADVLALLEEGPKRTHELAAYLSWAACRGLNKLAATGAITDLSERGTIWRERVWALPSTPSGFTTSNVEGLDYEPPSGSSLSQGEQVMTRGRQK